MVLGEDAGGRHSRVFAGVRMSQLTLERKGSHRSDTPRKSRDFLGLPRDTWWLFLPAIVPVILFSGYPLLKGIYMGFTDATAGHLDDASLNGFDNYVRLLGDTYFWDSFKIGLTWAVSVTGLQFVASLCLALLLNGKIRLRGLFRTIVLIPWALPPVVIGIVWKMVYHPNAGLLNKELHAVGLIDTNINWLSDLSLALPAGIVAAVWSGLPQTSVVLLAAIQNVPKELRESAAIDGAGWWQSFKVVTWQAIRPVALAIVSLDFIWNFNSFGLIYILTHGGPGGATRLPMLFAYEESFQYGNVGYAAALGNAMVIVIALVLVFTIRRAFRETS